MLDAALLARARGSRNNGNNNKKFMSTTIVSAEAKARLTEAVKNYTPPPSGKYRALEEVKESIIALRKKQASYQTIRAMLKDNAGVDVSHQTIARYCREVLDSARAKKPRHSKTAPAEQPTSIQAQLAAHQPFSQSRSRGSRSAGAASRGDQ
jgi:hypothetical protein